MATSDKWTNSGGGVWETGADWSLGVPVAADFAILPGFGAMPYTVTVDLGSNNPIVARLETATNATLDIAAGTFTDTGGGASEDDGAIWIQSAAQLLATRIIDGSGAIQNNGSIQSTGKGLTLDVSSLTNSGAIDSTAGTIVLSSPTIDNTGGVIEAGATPTISIVDFSATTVTGGTISAAAEGDMVLSDGATITGADLSTTAKTATAKAGIIHAIGTLGSETIENSTIDNAGALDITGNFEGLLIEGSTVTNTGQIDVSGPNATLTLEDTTVTNTGGVIDPVSRGIAEIVLDNATIVGGELKTSGFPMASQIVTVAGSADNVLNGVTLDGTLQLVNGSTLSLLNTFTNKGLLILDDNSSATPGNLELNNGGTTQLTGGGEVEFVGVVGSGEAPPAHVTGTLDNVDNTLEGPGFIGDGTGSLTLVNEKNGLIIDPGGDGLTIDTGNAVTNKGTIEAENSPLTIVDPLINEGLLIVTEQNMVVQGAVTGKGTADIDGTLEFQSSVAATQTVDFDPGGDLQLDNSATDPFAATIGGFGSDAAIDLRDINSDSTSLSAGYKASANGDSLKLTVTDGVHTTALLLLGAFGAAPGTSGNAASLGFVLTPDGTATSTGEGTNLLYSSPI